ncbi:MAG: hypothetical protein AB2L12_11150 [Smithellaceae bacterium]
MLAAMDLQMKHRYAFRDSLIIAAAIKSGASILLTEDLNNGQMIEDVMIKNPFVS